MNLIEEQWHLEAQGEEIHSLFAFCLWFWTYPFTYKKAPRKRGKNKTVMVATLLFTTFGDTVTQEYSENGSNSGLYASGQRHSASGNTGNASYDSSYASPKRLTFKK